MKYFISTVFLLLTATALCGATTFVRGADVSWCTEMEDDGVRFRNTEGGECDIFALMKATGMTAIRLRVWVNPTRLGYGPYSDRPDVLAKARRAHALGLDLMIDFHYSDFFADPGTQTTPADWQDLSFAQLKAAVESHTRSVLQALKDEGIAPRWVQVGNETNSGMLWPQGRIDWSLSGSARYANYVVLHNAGYDAAKSIFPETAVMLHLANAFEAGNWDGWFVKEFKAAGGKFDMIGLSHYPDYDNWNSTAASAVSNRNAANSVRALGEGYGVPVMICETGFSNYDPTRAKAVMQDLFDRLTALPQCAGIFYWEPEANGTWMPRYYRTLSWNAYGMGAFSADGRPTAALDPFRPNGTSITTIRIDASGRCAETSVRCTNPSGQCSETSPQCVKPSAECVDLHGRNVAPSARGLHIMKQGAAHAKIWMK